LVCDVLVVLGSLSILSIAWRVLLFIIVRIVSSAQGMEEEVKAFALEPMVKILRILNTIRTEEIGIPLSISQYQILTPQILINRLLNRCETMFFFPFPLPSSFFFCEREL
jgi:hypothetical protein